MRVGIHTHTGKHTHARTHWASELDGAALRYMLHHDGMLRGGAWPQVLYRNMLQMNTRHVKPTRLGFVTLPCVAWSSLRNGHGLPCDMAHAPTRAITQKFCELLKERLWEIVVMESLVHFYNDTDAWRLIRTTAEAAGYALVALETFVAREVGLPTGRERRIAAFSRVGRGKYDLAEVWRELARLEKAGALSLKECLIGDTATTEQRSYGVTAEMLRTQREISEKKQARLAEALAKAKLTVEAAQKACTYCVDLAKSSEWTRVSTGAPTITAGYTRKSLWLPHLGRYARGVTRPGA